MGTAALKLATCPECGTELLNGARFCHRCGWDSKNAAAGAAPAVTAAVAYGRPAWKRRTMALVTAITAMLVLALALRPGGAADREIVPGMAAPDFSLSTLDGKQLSLGDLRGKYVVLNFWATWCPPCRAEMPALQAAYEQYRDQGLVVVGVNLDESPVAIASFTEKIGIGFPIVLDRGLKVTERYRILPLPTTFFIGPDGVVQDRWQGEMQPELVDELVRTLLESQVSGL